jgi:quinol-cytochrome oxidoreductase complex cytochrome b subunit/coenzyme F420-reducing hydrogenase delta subunit
MVRLLRTLWLRVENVFNVPFGQTLNPWYHLGAISFFLFWVVLVTGIYLYIFYRTGVQQAYESVESLTHAQWYAGGVMRSMHRYASDAMVASMTLHMLRNFATGRFRNFRWFSWVSGVGLIWLVYACGINGYWLVWDRLAQFIGIATMEWFGWLPVFSEPPARTFLQQTDVGDRFFTLLSFAHITLPLVLLGVMWIHTKRINSAETTPPRSLASGTLLMLLALSLVYPALSQGRADLGLALNSIRLDWFFLAPFPVLYSFSPGMLWLLLAAVTIALLAAPWLFRRPARLPVEVQLANCNGCSRCAADCPYSAIVMQPRQDGRPYALQPAVAAELCASCGICVGSCPFSMPFRRGELVSGLELPELSTAMLRAETDRAVAALRGRPRLLVFGCDRGYGVHALRSTNIATVSLPCIGMLPPAFIDYALRDSLADGVLVTGCREGDCHFRLGIAWIEQRIARERLPHLRRRSPTERIEICWADAPDRAPLDAALVRLRERVASLAPDPD